MDRMTFFGTLAPVIQAEFDRLQRKHSLSTAQTYDEMAKAATALHDAYFCNGPATPDYANDFIRLAYLYKHVPANANGLSSAIENSLAIRRFLSQTAKDQERLRVCALAGGPGTELLALAKYYCSEGCTSQVDLDFLLLDIHKQWAASWESIKQALNEHLKSTYGKKPSWPIRITDKFYPCDLTDVNELDNAQSLVDRDLYVMHSFLSELFHSSDGLNKFMCAVASQAPSGSRFVFLERRGSMWARAMAEVAA